MEPDPRDDRDGSRSRPRRRWVVGALLVAGLAAIPLGGWLVSAPSAGPLPAGPGGGSENSNPVIVAPAYVPSVGVRDLGPMPSARSVDVAVGLAPRDPAGLAAWTTLEYTPGSPEFHQFLTPDSLALRFGPDPGRYSAAVAYLEAQGLTVQPSPDQMLLEAQGPAGKVAAAFHTSFDLYQSASRQFFSHPTPAVLPGGFPWAGVIGLGNVTPAVPALAPTGPLPRVPLAGCSSNAPFAPCAIEAAYNSSGLLGLGINGTGYRIGVVDTYDGIEPQSTLASDLASFTKGFGIVGGPVQYLYPVPTSTNLNQTSSGWGLEESLDLEWSRAMAPGATVKMTFAPDPTAGLYGSVDWLVAHQAVDVISLSWGEPDVGEYNSYAGACASACNATSDGSYTLLHPVLADAVAEGIGIFSSSGDCGSADGTNGVATSYPASDPGVTGVGGTVLVLRNGSYSSESGWSGNVTGSSSPGCQNQGGSGGGYSPFGRPYWQSGPGVPSSPATRGVPDVSLVGGTPVSIVYNGFSTAVQGTSAGTPMWSAFEAISDQRAGHALGSLNPSLYRLAAGPSASQLLHDVGSGWNGYSAGSGWDAVTGLGTPNLGRLAPKLSAGVLPPSNFSVELSVSPRIGPWPLDSTFYVNTTGGPFPLVDVDFGDGRAAVATGGKVSHLYTQVGVYVARATVFDRTGNSTTSPPVAVVVGGSSLNVTLASSLVNLTAGQSTNLTSTVVGGTSPYRYWYSFGDGTYLDNSTRSSVAHAYPLNGHYCPAVVAMDSGRPQDGGVSNRVAITVGGGVPQSCGNSGPLTASLSSAIVRADLPGDLPLRVTSVGGTPPVSVRYVSDDPYVSACSCGIFRVPGNHTVTAFVNDSVNEETIARLNVTLLPEFNATFAHSPLAGRVPFTATFSDRAFGGDGTSANGTSWSFGDGTTTTGSNVTHTWGTPGFYLVLGQLNDSAGGETSAAFLVDALPLSIVGMIAVTAAISPAVKVPAGTLVTFSATASGGVGPYLFRWDLGDGDSGFGASLSQTFPATPCLANGSCPLTVRLSATDAAGGQVSDSFSLAQPVRGEYSAVAFSDSTSPVSGSTPLHVGATATATGMPNLSTAWLFGDGGSAAGPGVNHTYYTAGNFTLQIRESDAAGDSLVRTHAIVVTGPARTAPQVVGGPPTLAALAPLRVQFNVSGTGGTGPYTFNWVFGDGSVGSGPGMNHTYAEPGAYTATVTITDSLGSSNSTSFHFLAYAPTVVDLAAALDRSTVPAGSSILLTLWSTVQCTNLSAPGCEVSAVTLRLAYLPEGGGPPIDLGTATPGVTGGLELTYPAPLEAGGYLLNATVTSVNFTGSVQVALTVIGVGGTTARLLPYVVEPAMVVLGGILVAAVVVAAVAVALRRRPSPSPRRAEPAGGRVG
ncbi:MAG TPA: PKD domain-containing protein [Thermoplasmata archaeon]|nr:PKD domain-containing protein [Thermoplasmata archaeon]